MKILFVSNRNRHFENTNTYRVKAIEELGHEPLFFEDQNFIIPGRIRQRVSFFQNIDLARLNRKMIAFAEKTKPDVCLAVGGYHILPETLMILKRMEIPSVLWTTDLPEPAFHRVVDAAPYYDRIFCAGTEAMDILEGAGRRDAVWLPFACDPSYHRSLIPNDNDKVRYAKDVVFVGSYYPNRWEILRGLTHLDIGIWGPGWDRVIDNGNRNFVKNIYLNHTEWIKIYNSAKIVIAIHYQDGHTPCHQASPKVFESLACKCFVLVDRQKDLFRMFRSGQHLVAFENIEDLKDKIDYFLTHENERKSIADNGHKEVINKHTYRHRIQYILNHIE